MKTLSSNLIKKAVTVAMVVPMATTSVFAADETKNTTVKYEVMEEYTWTVPTEITFTAANTPVNGTVSVTSNVIGEGKKLNIKISGDQQFKIQLENGGQQTRSYVVKKDSDTLVAASDILSVASGTNTGSQELTYTLDSLSGSQTAEVAGSYTGTLSYTASVD